MKMQMSIALLLAALSFTVMANERETLVGMTDVDHGGFGGPVLKLSSLDGELNVIDGAKGAWLIDHGFYFGGSFSGTADSISDTKYGLGYGGLMIGYIGMPHRLVHYTLELSASIGDLVEDNSTGNDFSIDNDMVQVIEPAFYLSFNLVTFATVNAGVSYRYVMGSDTPDMGNDKLRGVTVELNIMFGKF